MTPVYLEREGVDTCIKAINDAIEALKDAAGSIDGTFMNELGGFWQGDSYNKCMETCQQDYQAMLTKTVPDMAAEFPAAILLTDKVCWRQYRRLRLRYAGVYI